MIKTSKCKLCDRNAFSKGYCQQHSPKKPIKSAREKTTEKKIETTEIREVYFDYHLQKCTQSEHSGISINNPTRSNICHILPKSTHPSVQDLIENCVYLTFSEHERFDKLLFSLEFDKLEKEFGNTWDKILIRLNNFVNLCTDNTRLLRELIKYTDGRKPES